MANNKNSSDGWKVEYLTGAVGNTIYGGNTIVAHATYKDESYDYPMENNSQALNNFQKALATRINADGVIPVNPNFKSVGMNSEIWNDPTLKNDLPRQQIMEVFKNAEEEASDNVQYQALAHARHLTHHKPKSDGWIVEPVTVNGNDVSVSAFLGTAGAGSASIGISFNDGTGTGGGNGFTQIENTPQEAALFAKKLRELIPNGFIPVSSKLVTASLNNDDTKNDAMDQKLIEIRTKAQKAVLAQRAKSPQASTVIKNALPHQSTPPSSFLPAEERLQGQSPTSVSQSTQELETELQQRHEMLAQKGDLSGGQNHAINYQARLNAIEADLRNGNTSDLANQIGLAKQNIAADTRFESGQLKPTTMGSAALSPNGHGIRS